MEPGLTDLDNQMEQAELAAGHLINIKVAIDSLLLKRKHPHEGVEIKMRESAECIIPIGCRRQSFYQSF